MSIYTKKGSFDDGLASRSRTCFLLVFDSKNDVLFKWDATTVQGVILAGKSSYHKNGKWSSTTTEFSTPEHVYTYHWTQGFESGKFFEEATWADQVAAIHGFFPKDAPKPSAEAVELFIRSNYPNTAGKFDEQDKVANSSKNEGAAIREKQRLLADIKRQIVEEEKRIAAIEQQKQDAAKLQAIEANRARLKKGMSLAELQEILKNTENI